MPLAMRGIRATCMHPESTHRGRESLKSKTLNWNSCLWKGNLKKHDMQYFWSSIGVNQLAEQHEKHLAMEWEGPWCKGGQLSTVFRKACLKDKLLKDNSHLFLDNAEAKVGHPSSRSEWTVCSLFDCRCLLDMGTDSSEGELVFFGD